MVHATHGDLYYVKYLLRGEIISHHPTKFSATPVRMRKYSGRLSTTTSGYNVSNIIRELHNILLRSMLNQAFRLIFHQELGKTF